MKRLKSYFIHLMVFLSMLGCTAQKAAKHTTNHPTHTEIVHHRQIVRKYHRMQHTADRSRKSCHYNSLKH